MNFAELQQIIQEIKETIPCKECGSHFQDEGIRIIGNVLNETYLMIRCHTCKSTMIINIVATPARKHRKIKKVESQRVNKDDILDMQNFLKDFDGNFSQLFKKKS